MKNREFELLPGRYSSDSELGEGSQGGWIPSLLSWKSKDTPRFQRDLLPPTNQVVFPKRVLRL